MKSTFFALIAAALLFTACGGGDADKQDEGMEQDEMQQEQMQQGETAGQVIFYCPMECEGDKTYTEMGTCPVCGMDLVEKGSADGDADHMHEGHDHEGHDHEGHDHGDEGSM